MKTPPPKTKPANAQPSLWGKPQRLDPLALRSRLGLNQSDFWHPLCVTQSGGSRYERGRKIPQAVATLLELVYIRKIDLKRFDADDIKMLSYLKTQQRDLYATLVKAAKQKSAVSL